MILQIQNVPSTSYFELSPRESVEKLNDRLLTAAENGQKQEITDLLNQGADIETTDYRGDTPLICATSNGHFDVV